MGRLPRASLLAALTASVVLFLPAPRSLGVLEAKGALLILCLGALAVWGLAKGNPAWTPPNRVAEWAWALALVHALSACAAGFPPGAAFRTAEIAALALALGWASRTVDGALLFRTLAALGALTGILVSLQRACLVDGSATFDHKGLAAAFLSVALPACLDRSARESGFRRALALAALTAVVCGLVVGETRAAWVAAAVGSLPVLVSCRTRLWVPALVVAGALIAAGVLGWRVHEALGPPTRTPRIEIPLLGRFTSIWRNREPRIVLWQASVKAWRARPLLGHAPGSFVAAAAPPASRLLTGTRIESFSTYAHNDFLQTAVETGLIGLGALLGLASASALAAFRSVRSGNPFACVAAGGLLAGAVNALLCFPLYDPGCSLALAVLAGVAAGASPGAPSVRPRPALAVLAALAVLLSLRIHRPPWPGEARREAGRAALLRGETRRGRLHLERAVLEAPWDPQARMGLARARFQDGDPEGAYAVLDGAVRDFPFESAGQFHLAWGEMLFRSGRPRSEACSHLETVISKYPGSPEAEAAARLRAACPPSPGGAMMPP